MSKKPKTQKVLKKKRKFSPSWVLPTLIGFGLGLAFKALPLQQYGLSLPKTVHAQLPRANFETAASFRSIDFPIAQHGIW